MAQEPGSGGEQLREPLRLPDFRRFWSADALTTLGVFTTAVIIDVLVVQVLHASEAQVGLIRAVQFLPYLLVGLLAGALVDRWRRRPVLVITNLGVGLSLLVITLLHLIGALSLLSRAMALFVLGCFSVFRAAAEQSYVPDLVPRRLLVTANARTGQSATVAETSGPALGGALASALSAPWALCLNAASSLAAALIILRIKTPEPSPEPEAGSGILRSIQGGLRFTYRHRMLTPLAVSTHIWFIANSAAITVFSLLALRQLGLSPLVYGVVLACAGVGGLVGAFCAPALSRWLGEGTAIIVGRSITPIAWVSIALIPHAEPWALFCLGLAKALYGFGLGLENPPEMGYWQAMTPRGMMGRVNAARRSVNRTMAVVGSLVGGVLAGAAGYRETIWEAIAVFLIAVGILIFSPVRGARSEAET